jgi:hypothetical protein
MKILQTNGRKIAVNPKTGEVRDGFGSHANWLRSDFDTWVRAILFPGKGRVYFRFFKPSGDYYFIDENDRVKSFDTCYTAWEILIRRRVISKKLKPLFAETDHLVTEVDIKY